MPLENWTDPIIVGKNFDQNKAVFLLRLEYLTFSYIERKFSQK